MGKERKNKEKNGKDEKDKQSFAWRFSQFDEQYIRDFLIYLSIDLSLMLLLFRMVVFIPGITYFKSIMFMFVV